MKDKTIDTPAVSRVIETLSTVGSADWNALAGDNPFVRHEFLSALEASGCVSEQTGWAPRHMTHWRKEQLVAAMPLYLKFHSYGEYVFDWAWADAYQRHGFPYYPKLLSAIPFSPVTGPRLLAKEPSLRTLLLQSALDLANEGSSLHVLFPEDNEVEMLESGGMMIRRGVQFHWRNIGYKTFDEFLGTLSHDKRKKIKQERRKVSESGVRCIRIAGSDIRPDDWRFFNRCYRNTYHAHHSTPYLNLEFFERIGTSMPENLMLVIAELDGVRIASTLNVFNGNTLYGRYWGATEHVPNLHFEACYYQAIEFCIEIGIALFEGGAQGEHKLARGFLPVQTRSFHWLKHEGFADAVERFLAREASGIDRYVDELSDRSPFKQSTS